MSLEMKTVCESCEAPLKAEGAAFICSYECTFCEKCTREKLQHVCPNCQGELVRRPRRRPKVE